MEYVIPKLIDDYPLNFYSFHFREFSDTYMVLFSIQT